MMSAVFFFTSVLGENCFSECYKDERGPKRKFDDAPGTCGGDGNPPTWCGLVPNGCERWCINEATNGCAKECYDGNNGYNIGYPAGCEDICIDEHADYKNCAKTCNEDSWPQKHEYKNDENVVFTYMGCERYCIDKHMKASYPDARSTESREARYGRFNSGVQKAGYEEDCDSDDDCESNNCYKYGGTQGFCDKRRSIGPQARKPTAAEIAMEAKECFNGCKKGGKTPEACLTECGLEARSVAEDTDACADKMTAITMTCKAVYDFFLEDVAKPCENADGLKSLNVLQCSCMCDDGARAARSLELEAPMQRSACRYSMVYDSASQSYVKKWNMQWCGRAGAGRDLYDPHQGLSATNHRTARYNQYDPAQGLTANNHRVTADTKVVNGRTWVLAQFGGCYANQLTSGCNMDEETWDCWCPMLANREAPMQRSACRYSMVYDSASQSYVKKWNMQWCGRAAREGEEF